MMQLVEYVLLLGVVLVDCVGIIHLAEDLVLGMIVDQRIVVVLIQKVVIALVEMNVILLVVKKHLL